MWITDLQTAFNELFDIYGVYCCVERIQSNIVTMTNGDKWDISNDGHISKIEIQSN